MNILKRDPASFRDRDGFVFEYEGSIYRAIHENYVETYKNLIASGLYRALVDEELLVSHEEETTFPLSIPGHPLIIRPFQVKQITYPYEWPYEQYRDAALCTLRIQELALSHGLSLKDASPYNIQFIHGKPRLIDTLSFFSGDQLLWTAYRQFCESFLAPLALMAFVDHDIVRTGQVYNDGIPLLLASTMLPWRTWLRPSLCIHLHLHARSERSGQDAGRKIQMGSLPANQKRLIFNLRNAVESLPKSKTYLHWKNYYSDDCTHPLYLKNKIEIMEKALTEIKPQTILDIGCNTGVLSKIASAHSELVIALDRDPSSIEALYCWTKQEKITNLIPLVMNILNPSPTLGWMSSERRSFLERMDPDVMMMLGISHHLIGQANITFPMLADLCLKSKKYVLFEFIPDTDSNFGKLFRSRAANFIWYTREEFLSVFTKYFTMKSEWKVEPTERMIYLFEKKDIR
jgi:SAM-dependent methyltransferase